MIAIFNYLYRLIRTCARCRQALLRSRRLGWLLALPLWAVSALTASADSIVPAVGKTVLVGEDEIQATTGLADGNIDPALNGAGGYLYDSVILLRGGRWQPLDHRLGGGDRGRIQVDSLETGSGAIIDLSYYSTRGLRLGTPQPVTAHSATQRQLFINRATLADGSVFRLAPNAATSLGTTILKNNVTRVVIANASGGGTIYLQLGYDGTMGDPGKSYFDLLAAAAVSPGGEYLTTRPDIYPILTIGSGYEAFTVAGQKSLADAPLYVYEIEPYIHWDASSGIAYFNGYKYIGSTNRVSESVKATADVHRSLRNLWRVEESSLFSRLEALRQPDGDAAKREGAWAYAFRGKLNSDSGYGRSVSQDYDGLQAGYDKRRAGDFHNGRLYTGLMVNRIDSGAAFASGKGDLRSEGLGVYGVWAGDRGHYLDLSARASRLTNSYRFHDSSGEVASDYDTWALGLSSHYGYRQRLRDGWFWEPQIGLAYGNVAAVSYRLSNYLAIQQNSINTLTGSLGLTVGKALGENGGGGSVYVKAAALRNLREDAGVRAAYAIDSEQVATGDGSDSWYRFNLGAKLNLSPDSEAYLDLSRTTGGKLRTDWQVSGGLAWRWGGGQPRRASEPRPLSTAAPAVSPVLTSAGPAAAGDSAIDYIPVPDSPAAAAAAPQRPESEPAAAAAVLAVAAVAAQPGDYVLPPLTVEAPRPLWEQQLSPGSVSVIYPQQFKGEQKKLPELLETVPGIHINRVNGIGQYTTATIRGSSAAQVDVYVDGVLMNRGGDAAVDLSLIPVENVARIEVYRGYVPARFAGAAIGGVINIVTSKPQGEGLTVSQGVRSFGGYQSSLEYRLPLGGGTLLLGLNRDQSDGDFAYTRLHPNWTDRKRLHRKDNSFRHDDAVVKWQDDNWLVKAAWNESDRYYPASTSADSVGTTEGSGPVDTIASRRNLTTRQKTLLLGRRQTAGGLEWGWQLDWLEQNKDHSSKLATGTYPGERWSSYDSRHAGIAVDGTWKLGASHLLEFRADYARERMDVNASDTATSGSHGRIYFLPRYDFDKYHLHLQDNIALNSAKDLILSPLVRAERVKMSTNTAGENKWQYSYGVGLKKTVNAHWTLKSSYGTYNRFPNFYEIFGDGIWLRPVPLSVQLEGVGKPTWEHSTQFDLGASWNGRALNANANFNLTYFHRDIDNLMMLYNNKLSAWYGNYGSATARGIELDGGFAWQRWDLKLAATRIDSTRRRTQYNSPVTGIVRGGTIPDIPEWEGNLRLSYRFPGERLALFAENHYTGSLNKGKGGIDGAPVDSLHITNLGFRYDLSRNWKITGGVNDVFNRGPEQRLRYWGRAVDHDPATAGWMARNVRYPQQGRTYYLTTQRRF